MMFFIENAKRLEILALPPRLIAQKEKHKL